MSEHLTNQTGQEVLWLAASEPPAQFVAFLRSRGLSLLAREAGRPVPAARLTMIEASNSPATRAPNLAGRRLAIMHPDPGSADALAQALRAKGAEVAALSLNPESLHRVEALDPDVVIMEPADFTGSCWEIVRALWQHPRLRFATLLLATPELMGNERVSALDVHDLSFAVHRLAEDYERTARAAQADEPIELSLATLGPARTLRALLESGGSLRARFVTPECAIEVDVAEKIIVGAQSETAGGQEPLLGVHALAFLMTQHEGTVQVRPVDHPAQTNVMAPLDTALHMAREVAGVQRPSGVRWAAVANHNSQPPAARVSKVPLSSRTLIGIPAVKVPDGVALDEPKRETAPAKQSPSARPAAVLAKPAAPITVMPPTPRISIAPAESRSPAAEPRAAPAELTHAAKPLAKLSVPPAAPRASVRPAAPRASVPPAGPTLSLPPAAPPSVSTPPAPLATASVPPPTAEPVSLSATPGVLPTAAQEIAEALEPSLPEEEFPRAPSLLSGLLATVQRVHLKLAAVAVLAVIALWLCVRIVSALAAPTPSQAAAPARPPVAPRAPVLEAPAPATAPSEPSDESAPEEVRPSRKASELVSQGHVFRRKHMLPTARSKYLDALREVPGYPRALAGLAQLALESGDSAQALQFARQLVRVRGGQAGYHVLLGDAYQAAGQAKEARAAFETAARMGSRAGKQRLAR